MPNIIFCGGNGVSFGVVDGKGAGVSFGVVVGSCPNEKLVLAVAAGVVDWGFDDPNRPDTGGAGVAFGGPRVEGGVTRFWGGALEGCWVPKPRKVAFAAFSDPESSATSPSSISSSLSCVGEVTWVESPSMSSSPAPNPKLDGWLDFGRSLCAVLSPLNDDWSLNPPVVPNALLLAFELEPPNPPNEPPEAGLSNVLSPDALVNGLDGLPSCFAPPNPPLLEKDAKPDD